jgi:hypothetical protein
MPESQTKEPPRAEDGADPSYEDWSKEELSSRAREIGLQGRTLMTKSQLIKALRSR